MLESARGLSTRKVVRYFGAPGHLLADAGGVGWLRAMAMIHRLALHWFRRDLRLTDNPALRRAVLEAREVLAVFVVSAWEREHQWTGPARQEFLCGSLAALEKNLASIGGRLVFRRGPADQVLRDLLIETAADALYFNREPADPFPRAMEAKVAAMCRHLGVAVHAENDGVLHGAGEVLTSSGSPYRVFTPYARKWNALPKPGAVPRIRAMRSPAPGVRSDPCPTIGTWKLPAHTATIIEPGERAARGRLRTALETILPGYAARRNIPHGRTTSRLSQDLRFGLISIRELHHRCAVAMSEARAAGARQSVQTFINELAWREFYFALLWHHPEVCRDEFDPQWRGLPWSHDQAAFDRWSNGCTGFPIVDAGMRQLNATGFMHNRLRMITAMFLTKDLRLDWRLGEAYFMQKLVDGEIASNNGGWQWSAGTGADAAPYFRIQNPWSQTKSYDPDGLYIRRWCPELKDVPARLLATGPKAAGLGSLAGNYPAPMVDHAQERERTLAMFNRHREHRR